MKGEERGPWYLLTGLVIGIVLGLVYAWVIQPVKYVDTPPFSLRQDFKDRYRALIAAAYLANNDLVRAQARLELLRDENPFRTLSEQAQRTLAENGTLDEARALGLLAVALSQASPSPSAATLLQETSLPTATPPNQTPIYSPTSPTIETSTLPPSLTSTLEPLAGFPASDTPTIEAPTITQALTSPTNPATEAQGTPTETLKPKPSSTTIPSRTHTATPGGPFILLSREKICDQELSAPLFQVEALDRFGLPVPGVLVVVTWKDHEERFYTGLKPEKGLGYADFTPAAGIVYTLRLGEGGETVIDLTALQCKGTGGESYWGAWLLKFIQP